MGLGLLVRPEVDGPERPTVLAHGDRRDQFGSLVDLYALSECDGLFDPDLGLLDIDHLDPPDQIGSGRMGGRFLTLRLGVCDRDFERPAPFGDLLKKLLPFMSPAS